MSATLLLEAPAAPTAYTGAETLATRCPGPTKPGWRRDHLVTTAWALMANTGVTSLLGLVFWAAASAIYTPAQLGASAALISAMMLLSVISQVDLAMGISRLLPQVRARRWRPVLGAYGVAATVGMAVTAAFVLVAPRLSPAFGFLGHFGALGFLLILAVVLWNIFALQDAVLASARWAAVVPIENGVFGVLKIGLMVVLAHRVGGQGIFVGWVIAMAVMLLPVNTLIFARVLRTRPARTDTPEPLPPATVLPIGNRAGVARYLAADYTAGLLNQGYTAVLPLLVLAVLGRGANGYFYIVFMVSGAVRAIAQSMSTSLVIEGSHDETRVAAMARLSVVRFAKFALPGIVALGLGANLLLKPFGAAYEHNGATLLRLFLLAALPHAVITIYLSLERVQARVNRVLAVEALIVVLVTVGAVVGMQRYGLVGVGVAWLAAHTVVAAAVAPGFLRACRRSTPEKGRGLR
jgi:O-antigen/teichoic acid export membrane protein